MRILFLAGIDVSLPQGHAVHVRRLTDALERRGHTVRLVCLEPEGAIDWDGPERGGRVSISRPSIPRIGHFIAELRLHQELKREFHRFRPDLLLFRSESLTLAPFFLGSEAPPILAESNASIAGHTGLSPRGRFRDWAVRRAERRALLLARRVGAVTPELVQLQIERCDLDPEKIFVVPNGATLPPIEPERVLETRRSHGVEDGRFLIGFVGSLNRWQGLDTLLDAMTQLAAMEKSVASAPHLWIVGDGDHRASLETRARELGLTHGPDPSVSFLGGMPESTALLHAQSAQILVAPYPDSLNSHIGGGPLKVFQGMACDRPILYRGMPSIRFVEEIGAGERVALDSPQAWVDGIERWIETWHEAGAPIRDWPWPTGDGPGRAYITEHRTWDHTAEIWEREMHRVLEGGPSPV